MLLLAGSVIAVATGARDMIAQGAETWDTAARLGIGLLVGILSFVMMLNFLWGVRLMKAMRRGDNVLARWTVPRTTLAEFREDDARRNAQGSVNAYRPPKRIPPEGIDVIFSADGVILHDTFFGLSSTGLASFTGVRMLATNPLSLEFQLAMVTASNVNVMRFYSVQGALRIPVARTASAQAAKVLDHYRQVIARKIIVKPDFWRRRIRFGLIVAALSGLVAAAGFGLAALAPSLAADLGDLPAGMAVAGTVMGLAGLVLALLAAGMHAKQHRRR
jgi:hypothetical protein